MLCDANKILDELDLPDDEKEHIRQEIRAEFPDDDMLYELHLIRVARYLRERKGSMKQG